MLADAAAEAVRAGQDVIVVPTASPVQGLSALAVHDATRRPGEDVVAMAEAAAATRRGELVVAREQGITWAAACQPGDVLGLLDGEIVLIEAGPAGVKTSWTPRGSWWTGCCPAVVNWSPRCPARTRRTTWPTPCRTRPHGTP